MRPLSASSAPAIDRKKTAAIMLRRGPVPVLVFRVSGQHEDVVGQFGHSEVCCADAQNLGQRM